MPKQASTSKRKSTRKTKPTRTRGTSATPDASAESKTTPNVAGKADAWKTLDALPACRRQPIDQAILHRPEGLEDVIEIYKHFELNSENITLASFRRYTDLVTWRTRLGHIGKLVHELVGVVPDDEEDRWFRTAHLMLTATLIEALDDKKVEFKVADMVRLYKIFEDRRAASGSGKSKAGDSLNDVPNPDGKLPKKFADTIKDIYGVALDSKRDTAAPENTDAKVHSAEST